MRLNKKIAVIGIVILIVISMAVMVVLSMPQIERSIGQWFWGQRTNESEQEAMRRRATLHGPTKQQRSGVRD